MRWSEADYLSRIVLTHAPRQVTASLILNVRQKDKITTLSKPTDDALRENKREMFDGMRAYHESEMSHANYGFTALLAVAGADGAVITSLLFAERMPAHALAILWGLFAIVTVLCLVISATTHLKIDPDHEVYANFGAEYVATSQILGFYDPVQVDGKNILLKTNPRIGQGAGYRKTQFMIWGLSIGIAMGTLIFCLMWTCLLKEGA
jgi:hypothetical protein